MSFHQQTYSYPLKQRKNAAFFCAVEKQNIRSFEILVEASLSLSEICEYRFTKLVDTIYVGFKLLYCFVLSAVTSADWRNYKNCLVADI